MALENAAAKRPLPERVGRYRITGRVGRGAMGVVYQGHDDVMDRYVAIKVMMADIEDDPETSARFYREARAAGQLIHRNIVTIYDMGEDDGRPFIVMELLDGKTLDDYLPDPAAVSVEHKIDLMIQLAEALQIAHNHGIFHRDVKPRNLVVADDGTVKILDFGIARLASSSMTAYGMIVGTPDYMSPEQSRGVEIDHRSDIFSAGAVFYFMLTGRKPFAAPDLPAVLRNVQGEPPLPIRETEAPQIVVDIVMKALAKSPSDRYQRCADLIADLTRAQRELRFGARRLVAEARTAWTALESLLAARSELAAELGVVPHHDDRAVRQDVEGVNPVFGPCLRGRAPADAVPFLPATDLLLRVTTARDQLAAEVERLQQARPSFDAGIRAAGDEDWETAASHFDEALRILPASARSRSEWERCRRMLAGRHAVAVQVRSLVEEAQHAASGEHWDVAISLCEQALTRDAGSTEARAVRDLAVRTRENAASRGLQAAASLAVTTAVDAPSAAGAAGVRLAAAPEPAGPERRSAEAARLAACADAALRAGSIDEALSLATEALTADPRQTLARIVQGMAGAKARERAQEAERRKTTAQHVADAVKLLEEEHYAKARTAIRAAERISPGDHEAAAVLVRINEQEARTAALREKLRIARKRARAAAPMLVNARAAESRNDLVAAAWMAENALALDHECTEAKQILLRARGRLQSEPSLADETVNAVAPNADPEGTVTLGLPVPLLQRLTRFFRDWSRFEAPVQRLRSLITRPRAKV